jgi:hypothetical protein
MTGTATQATNPSPAGESGGQQHAHGTPAPAAQASIHTHTPASAGPSGFTAREIPNRQPTSRKG